MKITDIKVGTVYWYETSTNWGDYLTPGPDRSPVVRVDDKRYSTYGYRPNRYSSTYREDPKGRYVKVREVNEDGTNDPADKVREMFVQPTYIRDEMATVRRNYDALQVRKRDAENDRQAQAVERADEAASLRDRLASLGVEGIEVRSTDGRGYGQTRPKVVVGFDTSYKGDPVAALTAILDRLERAGRHVHSWTVFNALWERCECGDSRLRLKPEELEARLESGSAAERELAERRNDDPRYLDSLARRSMD